MRWLTSSNGGLGSCDIGVIVHPLGRGAGPEKQFRGPASGPRTRRGNYLIPRTWRIGSYQESATCTKRAGAWKSEPLVPAGANIFGFFATSSDVRTSEIAFMVLS